MCVCVRLFTLSNINISETSGPITMKFYQKHHWGGGKPAFGFGPDGIRTLVSMAKDSSHRVLMWKTVLPLFLSCFSFGLKIFIPQSVHDQYKDMQTTLGSERKRKCLFSSSPMYCNK